MDIQGVIVNATQVMPKGLIRKAFGFLVALLSFAAVTPTAIAGTSQVTYYYTDPQGSVLARADDQGNIVSSADRRPFGEQALGTPENGPGYAGHVDDAESSLVYMQARYYDPQRSQFLSVDPAAVIAGDVTTFGRFSYASNNPLTNIDPDGRQTLPPSSYQINWRDPGTRQFVMEGAIAVTPVAGDVQNIVAAIEEPSAINIAAAAVGLIPEGGPLEAKILKGTAGGERAGKVFTRAGKSEVKAANAAAHDGKVVCSKCGVETVPAKQSQRGVTPPGNEAHVDHVIPQSKGGDGSPSNGQVLCRDCNLDKSDHHE